MDEAPIKAIVVDDERNARKLLPILIDWAAIGYEFVGEAADGNEALDLIDSLKPDVVFADISMPFMDGLELAGLIREREPLIKIVMVTAFADFDYAKRSVKLGVCDFLLKPLQTEILTTLAEDLKGRIRGEAAHWGEYRRMKAQLDEHAELLRERFLNELVGGSADAGRLQDQYRYFFGEEVAPIRGLAVIEALPGSSDEPEEDRLLLGMRCQRFVETLFADRPGIIVFRDIAGRIVLLDREPGADISHVGDQCIRLIRERLGLSVSVGVGGGIADIGRAGDSYREALEALLYGKLIGGDHVVSFGEDLRLERATWKLPVSGIEEAAFFVKAGAEKQAAEAVDRLFGALSDTRGATIEQAYSVAVHFVSLLDGALTAIGLPRSELEWDVASVLGSVFQAGTITELNRRIVLLAKRVSESIRRSRLVKKDRMIDKVRNYVTEEFADPGLTLSSVSEKFDYNASYLSRAFKQAIGSSFTDYLLRLRMAAAVKLIDETDLKAYQIAERVGIKDPYYFSYCFKKVLGVSIQDYKKIP